MKTITNQEFTEEFQGPRELTGIASFFDWYYLTLNAPPEKGFDPQGVFDRFKVIDKLEAFKTLLNNEEHEGWYEGEGDQRRLLSFKERILKGAIELEDAEARTLWSCVESIRPKMQLTRDYKNVLEHAKKELV